jgi:hypothetical protein
MQGMAENITMVMLPQAVWEQMLQKIENISVRLEMSQGAQAPSVGVPERIPIVKFKTDKNLSERYGITYTVIRDLALRGHIKTYCDDNRERGRWTTHEDIMSYFAGIKKMGITA